MSAFEVAFQPHSTILAIASFVVPIAITVGGALWAYFGFQAVIRAFDEGFLPFPSEESIADLQL